MKILITGGSGFIGTNLTLLLVKEQIPFVNIDIVEPKLAELIPYWIKCDILNFESLQIAFSEFEPTAIIHLAAETDTDPSKKLKDYISNTVGSRNVVDASVKTSSVNRFILTSTQFVNQSGRLPQDDEDYAPHTIYGESKIESERYLRSVMPNFCWTIIRPTNIWGPWHLRYPFEFWKILAEGKYFHPGRKKVIRSYGYVGNVIGQMMQILSCERQKVDGKVFYVGDEPIDIYDWVNGFSLMQTGRKIKVIPRAMVFGLAVFGDVLRIIGVRFPITTSRFRSMTTDNPSPMKKTFDVLGRPKFTMGEGISRTVDWLRIAHPDLVKK